MPFKGLKSQLAFWVGAAVFAGVIYSLGITESWRALKDADFQYVSFTLVLFVAGSYLRMYKWVLMRDRMNADITFAEMNGIYFSSKFWGLVSPMRSGEVAPAIFRDGERAQRGRLLSIILYDRVIETFQSLIVFTALFFLLYEEFFNVKVGYALAGVSFAVLLFSYVLVSKDAGERLFGIAESALARLGRPARGLSKFMHGIRAEMEEFYESTKSYFTVGFSLYTLFITFVGWGVDMAFWVVLFRAFGIHTDILMTVTAVLIYSMLGALAPVPNGLGIADLSFALVLGKLGYRGEVGGLIILSRILVVGYVFLGYALFSMPRLRGKP